MPKRTDIQNYGDLALVRLLSFAEFDYAGIQARLEKRKVLVVLVGLAHENRTKTAVPSVVTVVAMIG